MKISPQAKGMNVSQIGYFSLIIDEWYLLFSHFGETYFYFTLWKDIYYSKIQT